MAALRSAQSRFSLVHLAQQTLDDVPSIDDPSALEMIESEMERYALSSGRGAQIAISLGTWDSAYLEDLHRLTDAGAQVWAFIDLPTDQPAPDVAQVTYIRTVGWDTLQAETFYLIRAADGSGGITGWNDSIHTGIWSFDPVAVAAVWDVLFRTMGIPLSASAKTGDSAGRRALEQIAHYFESRNLEFIEHLVHDMRQPLSALRGSVNLLEDHLQVSDDTTDDSANSDPQSSNLFRQIRANGDFLTTMVENFLFIQSSAAGQLTAQLQAVPVAPIFAQLRDLYGGLMNKRRFTLTAPDSLEAFADPDLLTRVISNLIANAQKYTNPLTGEISITADAVISENNVDDNAGETRLKQNVVLRVKDNGRGIPLEIQTEIFKKYFKSEAVGAERRGFGLGLAFCQVAVEAMHGDLQVQSGNGQGATFQVTLPGVIAS